MRPLSCFSRVFLCTSKLLNRRLLEQEAALACYSICTWHQVLLKLLLALTLKDVISSDDLVHAAAHRYMRLWLSDAKLFSLAFLVYFLALRFPADRAYT